MRVNKYFIGILGMAAIGAAWGMIHVAGVRAADTPSVGAAASLRIEAGPAAEGAPVKLLGKESRRQVLVTGTLANGGAMDLTRDATYSAAPQGIVALDRNGLVTPLADGKAIITATAGGKSASLPIAVEQFNIPQPINFSNQIVPIFTKTGCNGGGCHGKSSGQNGFRLSLLGFEPGEDYEHLVKESRGRRLAVTAPEHSLLLMKAAAIVPHGGGKRIAPDSDDYRMIVRWIAQGMPFGSAADAKIARLEVVPGVRTMHMESEQQLLVIAHYTDGSTQDATRSAMYETNNKEMGKIDETGRLKVFSQPGDVAVMVRYLGQVGVFRATIPLGASVDKLPPVKSFVDELVFNKLKAVGMPPSEICDDATFVRRAMLDICGRPPTAQEAKQFIDDKDPAKRDKLIDTLVDSGEYADYFANKWAALLRNKRDQPAQMRGTYVFWDWIRESMYTNKPYDQFVRDVLGASGDISENPPVAWFRQVQTTNQQMEDTAQLFLGTRLQCAQCHHHPFEKWSQQDYYSFSAFFSTVGRKPGSAAGEEVIYHKRGKASATNKKTKESVKPAGLGSEILDLPPEEDPRQALVDWMARPDNRFFAPTLVNRYWKHFFGRGLVDPEDDMRATNPPTNPELLDALAKHFVNSKFDLKNLVRTICKSSTYQLSAIPNQHNAADKQYYSRYYPKRLGAEVLLDSVNQLAKAPGNFAGLPSGTRAVQLPDNSFNAGNYFLQVFGRPESSSACECERSMDASLAQSLHLFNSKELQDKIASGNGRAAEMAADKTRTDDQKITELYLQALARYPDAEDLARAKAYLAKPVKDKDGKEKPRDAKSAYEDIIWALMNTKEFLFNH